MLEKDVLCRRHKISGPTTGHEMDPRLNPLRSGFRQWPSAGSTHSLAHARENHPSEHFCTTSRPEDQRSRRRQMRSDDAECPKSLSGQSERRRSSNSWKTLHCHMTVEKAETSGIASTKSKRLWNAKQRVEVILVQHQNQGKTVPELCTFHPFVGLKRLDDDWKRP